MISRKRLMKSAHAFIARHLPDGVKRELLWQLGAKASQNAHSTSSEINYDLRFFDVMKMFGR